MKKTLSYVLVIAMLATMLPLQVFASGNPTIKVADYPNAVAGSSILVPVTMENNPAGLAGLDMAFDVPDGWNIFLLFDNDPEYSIFYAKNTHPVTGKVTWKLAGNLTYEDAVSPHKFAYAHSTVMTPENSNVLCWIYYTIPADAVNGTYTVGMTSEVISDGEKVGDNLVNNRSKFTLDPGTITVTGGVDMVTEVALTADQLPAPVKNEVPVTSFEGNGFTGAVEWAPAVSSVFNASTAYTAKVTLTATGSFVFKNGIVPTVANATVSNVVLSADGKTMTFDAAFAETAAKELGHIEVETAPNKTTYIEGEDFDAAGMKVIAVYDNGDWEYVDATVTDGTALTVGKTSVTIQYNGKTTTQAITVNEKPSVAGVTATVGELIYTGAAQTPVVTVKDGEKTLVEGTDYTVAVEAKTEVGAYTLTIAGMGSYKGEKSVAWNITEADITANDYALTLVIGGASHTLVDGALNIATVGGQTAAVVYGEPSNGCVKKVGNVLTAESVGTATITATITAPNHKALTKTITVNVTEKLPANVTLDVIKSEMAFDDAEHKLSEFVKPATVDQVGGELTYTLNGAAATLDTVIKNVGEYKIVANYVSDTHAGTASQTVVIKKAPVAVPTAAAGLIYNGSEQTGVAANDLYKVEGGAATNAGDYEATVTLNDAANYEWASAFDGKIAWSIAKKNVTVTIAAIADVVYTGTAHEPAVTVTPAELTKDVDYTVAYANNINAGTATVTVTAVESSNYKFTEAGKTFEIKQADHDDLTTSVNVLINKVAAYSVDLSALLNGIEGAEIVTVTAAANDITTGAVVVEGMSVNFVSKNVTEEGKTAVITVEVKSTNYKNFDIELTLKTVNKTELAVSGVVMDPTSYTFGDTVGFTGTPVAKLGEEEKDVEFVYEWYKGAELVGTGADQAPKNAGSYTLVVSVDDEQYMGKQEINFVINKLDVEAPAQQAAVVYNGAEQTYGVVANDFYTVSNATRKDVGTQEVTIALKDKANTQWVGGSIEDLKHNFTIEKLFINIPEQAAAVTYNGKDQAYAVVGNAHYTVKGTTTAKNAGEYAVEIELADKTNTAWVGDFTDNIAQKFIIKKAGLAVMADDKTVYVGDKELPALTYTVFGLQNGETLKVEPTVALESTPDLTKTGSVRITVSGAEAPNANYSEIQYVFATLEIVNRPTSGGENYPVKVEQPDNGEIKLSTTHAVKGDKVTITVRPDKGYELVDLFIYDNKGNEIDFTQKGDDKFTFKMPAGKVEIVPVFEKIGGDEIDNPFVDVAEKDYFYDAVLWAAENGITNGMSANEFMPGVICNRAQVVTFLWRAAGCPTPESMVMPFTDVAEGAYYYDAVLWAVENGITKGMSETEFAPNATVTRGQTVTFLWRAEKGNVAEGETFFVDVPADAYYASAVEWAVRNGITNGMSATEFGPNNGCTRGQIVTFLYRTFAK